MYRKNVAGQFICFQLLLTASGAVATGLSPTVRRCIDGTFAAGTGTVTEDSAGFYKYAMSQADTNGNNVSFDFTATGAMPVCANIVTTACDPTVGTSFGISNIDATVSSRMATYTQPTGFLAATFPSGTIANTANITTVGGIGSGGILRASFAADTGLQTIRSGSAAAGGASTITLDAGASAIDNFYTKSEVLITGGTGVGQCRSITGYVGATKVATISGSWATSPDNTSTFAIIPFDPVPGTISLTAAQTATAVWADTTAGDFTVASSIGKSLFTSGNAPGAASGLALVGSNVGAAASVTARVTANTDQINGDATAAANLAKTTAVIGRCTAGAGGTTTSVVSSACTPTGIVLNQFKGRIITFDANTTTTALRGQSTDITASSAAATPTFTVTALTTAPASGDTFSIT